MPTKTPKTQSIADLLREIRHRLNLSQQQLANQLGVSFRSVNRWENGHTIPSPLALKRIEELSDKAGLTNEQP